jgi:plastocyanin
MRGRRVLVLGLAFGVVLALALPAQAATVGIVDFAFSQPSVTVAQGQTVSWHNGGSFTHTSTQDSPLALWNTGNIAKGTTSSPITMRAAGVYPYHCAIHASMTARVRVPILISPSTGTSATTFTITLTSALQTGFVYDVQRKVGSGSWTVWKSGVTTRTVTFKATAGTYRFRSRLRKLANGATSQYSPAKTITVS